MQFAPLYPVIYRILQPLFPDCLWSGHSDHQAIALTFDDGPNPTYTFELLEVLDQYRIPASFFPLGICIQRSPEVMQAIYQRGHWIGLHGYTHTAFPKLSANELKLSLEQTQIAIAQACCLDPKDVKQQVKDVRPPNGLFTPQTLVYLRQWNYRPVMWSVVPEDWVCPGVSVITERILKQVYNGSLIVLHDGFFGGKDVAAIADRIIPSLLHQGYEFITVDRLWKLKDR
jgi:peptidoglycan/xylan/chitin deacetylase (PgdA/CDA1 family)